MEIFTSTETIVYNMYNKLYYVYIIVPSAGEFISLARAVLSEPPVSK